MNTDGHRWEEGEMTEDTEKREEGSGCTAKVAKAAKDVERRASHESTQSGTNADHTPDAWNLEPGTRNQEHGTADERR